LATYRGEVVTKSDEEEMAMAKRANTQRQALPWFEGAEGLGPQDAKFVQDLVAVLEKHGNLDRFGLCLLHDHFSLGDGEVLVETRRLVRSARRWRRRTGPSTPSPRSGGSWRVPAIPLRESPKESRTR
jgi:hypothetical protein